MERKEWIVNILKDADYRRFLQEVKDGDLIIHDDKEYGKFIQVWNEVFDRPQKLIVDSNNKTIGVENDYGQ